MAGTGPDRQSVPANEVVNESSTEPKLDTVSSLIRLMLQQQEAQAESAARRAREEARIRESAARRAREEARIREEESMQRKALLLKLAQILDGKESTASPIISTEKTSYIGVVPAKDLRSEVKLDAEDAMGEAQSIKGMSTVERTP